MNAVKNFLVYDFVENLTKKQTEELCQRGEVAKNILIYDYLVKNDPKVIHSKETIFSKIVSGKYDKTHPNTKKYFKFMTPKKELILNLYRQNLSYYLFDKFSHLKTKKELKQLYCLDEIYQRLNPNRKKRVNHFNYLPTLVNSSIKSYKNQLITQEMGKEIKKFEEIIDKIDYPRISFDQIKYVESRTETIIEYVKRESLDFEIKEKIQKSKEIIREAGRKMREGIDKRLTEEFKKNLEYFEDVNKKDFLYAIEFLNLKINKNRLSDLENILNYFSDSRVNDVSDTLKKHTFLISSHNYFCNHKKGFDLVLKKQKKLNRKIKRVKLKEESSFFEFIKRNKIKNYLKNTDKNFEDLSVFYENRYLRQKFNDEKETLIEGFKSLEPNEKWTEKILKQHGTYSLKIKLSQSNRKKRNKEGMVNLLDHIISFRKRIKEKDLLLKNAL